MRRNIILVLVIVAGLSLLSYRYFHSVRLAPVPRGEITLRIIPGWDLRQVGAYLVEQKMVSSTADFYAVVGQPAVNYARQPSGSVALMPMDSLTTRAEKPGTVSYEGYLAPETYRVYRDARLTEVIKKLTTERARQITPAMFDQAEASGRTIHQILTMASIIEREVKTDQDRGVVADILWRRNAKGMLLQVDSSVHYALGLTGSVFTTEHDRQTDSWWNTYKYAGLPPGPICNPGLASITAALNPEKNEYWYFLTGSDERMHYARTLDEHNRNKKYL